MDVSGVCVFSLLLTTLAKGCVLVEFDHYFWCMWLWRGKVPTGHVQLQQNVHAGVHLAESVYAPSHRGTECLDGCLGGWLKKGHTPGRHHINSPSLCHLRCLWHFKGESQGGVNPGAVESPPLRRAALHSPLFPRPWPLASSKCDQSAVCLWWMGPLWLTDRLTRDQEVEGSVTQDLLAFYAQHTR